MAHLTKFSGHCRYIVTDIDYTFIGRDRKMIQANLDAIRDAQAAGIEVAFATGRCMSAISDWCDQSKLTSPQVVDNGATLLSTVTKKVLDAKVHTVEACRFWAEGFHNAGFEPVICTPEDYYVFNPDDDVRHQIEVHDEHYVVYDSWEKMMADHEARAVKVTGTTGHRIAEIEALCTKLIAEAKQRGIPFSATYTEKGILVVTAENVSKISGVAMAARQLGISLEDVAAIGDGDNDADMLAGCGLGIALENGTDMAKAASSHVDSSCNDAGFAHAIRKKKEKRL